MNSMDNMPQKNDETPDDKATSTSRSDNPLAKNSSSSSTGQSSIATLPWIEKYRPSNLSEVISHDSKIEVLRKLMTGRQIPHLLFWGSPGSGKCLGKGTLVRLADGSLKKVENLKIGEKLMGDDLQPRTVLATCSGTDNLYKVNQSNGIDYIVNSPHILTLFDNTSGTIVDVPIRSVLQTLLDAQSGNFFFNFPYHGCRLNDISDPTAFYEENKENFTFDRIYTFSDITIDSIGEGEYYGFELDGNGRFLLEDNTLTHNTSSILALAKEMYGPNYKRYILELNASDDRGIEIVRKNIPTFANTKSDDMRLVILDEADAMTSDAQSALRRVMELYIKNCRFCLICNNINKIIPAIQSRCAKMRFGVLEPNSIRNKLSEIVEKEGIKVDDAAVNQLLEIHSDFRQILNTLQCLKSIRFGETITESDVVEYLGMANGKLIKEIIAMMNTQPFKKVYAHVIDLHRDNKIDVTNLISSLVNYTINREDIDELSRSNVIDGLASVEYRIITGSDTEIQIASLIGHMMSTRK